MCLRTLTQGKITMYSVGRTDLTYVQVQKVDECNIENQRHFSYSLS